MPLKIGVTGGIGSGKSLVCQIFRILGIPVFDADREAKNLMNSDPELRISLEQLAGKDIYLPSGSLDRGKLAGLIFNNREMLESVNNLVHPAVRRAYFNWHTRQDSPYSILESAILFESGFCASMDKNILITAPENLRVRRVIQRDGSTPEQVQERMRNQWPDEKKTGIADFIIHNDQSEFLIDQILVIHKKILDYGKIC